MRVLHVMAGSQVGGAEAFFERLVLKTHQRGKVEQRALIRHYPARTALLMQEGVPVTTAPFMGWWDLTTHLRLRALIREFKPDIIMAWMGRAASFLPAKTTAVKLGRLGGYYAMKRFHYCDHLIGNTPDIVAKLIKGGWPEVKVSYVPNFVSVTPAPAADRALYQTPTDVPLVLALGRYHPVKGFDMLLEALSKIPDAWLWLVGEGAEAQALKEQATALGIVERVRFLPWQHDPSPLYAAANVVVCASRHEPLGNVILEAWAAGTPIISTPVEGPSFLIAQGKTGWLSHDVSSAAIAVCLNEVLADKESAMKVAQAGQDYYQEHFSEERVLDHYHVLWAEKVKDGLRHGERA
jgi:glycosyltransferase involved in cell wall biosynthesis